MKKKYHDDKMGYGKGHANMPEKAVMKDYPKASHGELGIYKDDLEGIDAFGRENRARLEKQKKN